MPKQDCPYRAGPLCANVRLRRDHRRIGQPRRHGGTMMLARRTGFTLIELLVVIAIMTVLIF